MYDTDISYLQGKRFSELTPNERDTIQNAFLTYFDKYTYTKPRMKALAYCVLVGGVPTKRVGELTIRFKRVKKDFPLFGIHTDEVQTSLHWGEFELPGLPAGEKDGGLYQALMGYISTEKRFADYLPVDGKAPANMPDCVELPLFVREINTDKKGEPLKDCCLMFNKAARALNFKATSLRLHFFGDAFCKPKNTESKNLFASIKQSI